MTNQPDREAHSVVTPYLAVNDADRAIAFYKKAFGATETIRLNDSDGRVSHAEIRINNTPIFISDEYPDIDVLSPQAIGGSPVMIVLDVADVDAIFQQAVAAGAAVIRPLQDGFDGSLRTAKVNDPFGHRWMILTHKSVGNSG